MAKENQLARTAETPAPAAEVDALYRPFPDFADWGRLGGPHRDLWDRFSAELDGCRRSATPAQLARAVMVAVRSAAIDTGAIEGLYQVDRGFTMSVALQAFAWEQALAERGEAVRELFQAQLAAYELAIDSVTGRSPLSEAWLRSLHECICAPQKTYRVLTDQGWQDHALLPGRYKRVPNHVRLADGTFHPYAPVTAVAPEMHRLMEQLHSTVFLEAHPVEQAAYSHHALTAIHPFADGNGRVARALASVYLYKSRQIPFVVFAHQRPQYFTALEAADRADTAPWLAFVADRGVDTMQLVGENLRAAATPRPDEVAERSRAYGSRSQIHFDLDSLALRLLAELESRWMSAIAPLPGSSVERRIGDWRPRDGYRLVEPPLHPAMTATLRPSAPPWLPREITARVTVALDERNPFGFQVEALGSRDRLEIRDADVAPEISESLALRLDRWTERQLGAGTAELVQKMAAPAMARR